MEIAVVEKFPVEEYQRVFASFVPAGYHILVFPCNFASSVTDTNYLRPWNNLRPSLLIIQKSVNKTLNTKIAHSMARLMLVYCILFNEEDERLSHRCWKLKKFKGLNIVKLLI